MLLNLKFINIILIIVFSIANLEDSFHSLIHSHSNSNDDNNLEDDKNSCQITFFAKQPFDFLPHQYLYNNFYKHSEISYKQNQIIVFYLQTGYFSTAPPFKIASQQI